MDFLVYQDKDGKWVFQSPGGMKLSNQNIDKLVETVGLNFKHAANLTKSQIDVAFHKALVAVSN